MEVVPRVYAFHRSSTHFLFSEWLMATERSAFMATTARADSATRSRSGAMDSGSVWMAQTSNFAVSTAKNELFA